MFSAITGADAQTAEHTLEAFSWDLNRGVNFFLENGARMPLPLRPPEALDDDEPVVLNHDDADEGWRHGDGGAAQAHTAQTCERGEPGYCPILRVLPPSWASLPCCLFSRSRSTILKSNLDAFVRAGQARAPHRCGLPASKVRLLRCAA